MSRPGLGAMSRHFRTPTCECILIVNENPRPISPPLKFACVLKTSSPLYPPAFRTQATLSPSSEPTPSRWPAKVDSRTHATHRCVLAARERPRPLVHTHLPDAQTPHSIRPATKTPHTPAQSAGGVIGGARSTSVFLAAGAALVFPLRNVDDSVRSTSTLVSAARCAARSWPSTTPALTSRTLQASPRDETAPISPPPSYFACRSQQGRSRPGSRHPESLRPPPRRFLPPS